jgi:putative peptidoglycan lipid II flippase
MKKTALLLMLLTIISKILGFSRDIALAYFFGASSISDAYLISLTIPIIIFGFIGAGISTGYIPLYSKIEENDGIIEANKFTNNLINILLVVCTTLIILALLFSDLVVKIVAAGFEGETLSLAIKFTKVSIFSIYFTVLINIFTGFLQVKKKFIIIGFLGFPFNLIILLSIFISPNSNIMILSIGSLVAVISQLLLLIPFIYQERYRYKFVINIKDKHIKSMFYIALPVIIGVSVGEINTLVDRTLASKIAVGGISAINYASRLNGLIQGVFVLPLVTVLFPTMAKMVAKNDISGLKKSLSEAISIINLLVIPATIGSMIYSEQIIKILFGRGAFEEEALTMTSSALLFYSIGMIGYGLREVLSRGFYSLQDTKTPMINAIIAMVMNVLLNFILSRYLGIGGLALATSISGIFCTLLLFVSLRKKVGPLGIRMLLISFCKIIIASFIMAILSKQLYNLLTNNINSNMSLIISIFVGGIIYFCVINIFKLKEFEDIKNILIRKVKKNNY